MTALQFPPGTATDRVLTRALRSAVVGGVVLVVVGYMSLIRAVGLDALLRVEQPVDVLMLVALGAVVWVASSTQPRNALLWVFAAFIVAMATVPLADSIMAINAPALELPPDITLIPADLPVIVAWTVGWSYAVQASGFFGLLTFGLLLFPDGRLPSRKWRPVAIGVGLGVAVISVSQVLSWLPGMTVAPKDNPLFLVTTPIVMLAPPASLAGLVVRYRKSDATTRAQIKWVMWGGAIMVPSVLLSFVSDIELLTMLGLLALGAAYGIAIVQHQLLDIDVVISRTLVYGALAASIGSVYVGVVVGLGSLVGSGDDPNTALAVGATALVAVAFQPVRRRLEQVANRVVFGRRATPYEVLAQFSHRVAATSEVLIDDVARSLAEGTRADRVAVSLLVDGESVETAVWPLESGDTSSEPVSFRIEDGDLVLGSLDVFLPPGQELGDDDRRLAEQLASGMGLALRNQLLTERLEARVEELRESRRRLVALQDETRRRIERDLHDGAQQQLVALKVKLGLGRAIAAKEGASQIADTLERLSADADRAVDAMREFARGVYPPLLEAEGLGSAIAAHARRASIPITVEADGVGRYPREIESAVYFCVLEALRNTAQHAHATHATVSLTQSNGSLELRVTDDGAGFGPDTPRGLGLVTMTDRIDALSGTLTVATDPGHGTTITGRVPVSAGGPA